MNTKCIIIDNEPLARDLIRNHISKLENFEIVAECGDAMKAMQELRDHKVDLMFMDIQMPQITGIEFLKILKNPPKVIITTAYREYVQIYTGKKKIITKTSMTNLEEKLPADGFLRIHKSFIVSMSRIEAFTAHTIEVPGKELPIGRSYKNSVLNALQLNGSLAQ